MKTKLYLPVFGAIAAAFLGFSATSAEAGPRPTRSGNNHGHNHSNTHGNTHSNTHGNTHANTRSNVGSSHRHAAASTCRSYTTTRRPTVVAPAIRRPAYCAPVYRSPVRTYHRPPTLSLRFTVRRPAPCHR